MLVFVRARRESSVKIVADCDVLTALVNHAATPASALVDAPFAPGIARDVVLTFLSEHRAPNHDFDQTAPGSPRTSDSYAPTFDDADDDASDDSEPEAW